MIGELAAAYDAAADAWAAGPAPVYDRLATELVAQCPVDLAGRMVVDLGAGTGSVSRAARVVGAEPVAIDLARAMLMGGAAAGAGGGAAIVADSVRLPLHERAVTAVLAGFLLSHTADPAAVLAEAGRVTEPGGAVLASAFDRRAADHPAKAIVDRVAAAHGWCPPPWYAEFKAGTELRLSSPDGLLGAAAEAGLDARVVETTVDTGVTTPEAVVAWRLGLAHVASWVAGLPERSRRALEAEACAAVGPRPEAVRPAILILVCQERRRSRTSAPARRAASLRSPA